MLRLLACLTLLCALPAAAGDLAIINARILPGPDAPAIERGTILIEEGRIVAVAPSDEIQVPEAAIVIDGNDRVVTAGFWNSHVHFLSPVLREAATRPAKDLDAALRSTLTRWGFTTVFDIASFEGVAEHLRSRIESGELTGPAILHVGVPFFPEHGTPVYIRDLIAEIGAASAEVVTADQAGKRAREQLMAGADGVKLFAGAIVGGEIEVLPMDVDIARAIVAQAHSAGKPAFAHPTNARGLEISLASGVDVLAHTTPFSDPWDEELVRQLRAADIALTPTLTLFEYELKRENAPDEVVQRFVENSTQQLRVFAQAGGTVLFGTDVDFIDQHDPQREYELMAQSGLDWRQILASLTTAPATRFDQAQDRGRIAVGMRADLVVLGTDPQQSVTAFSDVRLTIRNGRVIHDSAD